MKKQRSKAVITPYGNFYSITDAAKSIYENEKHLRAKWRGIHQYNTIINLQRMVRLFCADIKMKNWRFDE